MKRILFGLALIAVSCSVAVAATSSVRPEVGGGLSIPVGSLGDGWNLGFHGRFAVAIDVSPNPESKVQNEIVPEFAYHSFSLNGHGYQISGGTFSAILIGAGFRTTFSSIPSRPRFFLMGAIGIGIADISDFGGYSFQGESKLYYSPTAGVEFSRSICLSISYVGIALSGEAASFVPFTISVKI